MADIFRTVEVIFSAVDQTGNTIKSIGDNADGFTASISKLTAPLADFGDLALKAEAAIAGIGVAFAAVSIGNFAEFETSLLGLKRQLDDTSPSLDELGNVAIEMSNRFGVSSSSVVDGINEFKKASFSIEESIQLQNNALELMVAGDIEAAQATDILVKAIKGFGIEVEQVPRFSEALNNVADRFAVSVEQLAEGTADLSPIARAMGFSFEETMGILTPVIEIFGSGSEAADAFKTGLNRLKDDAKPVQDALRAIGVSQFDANGHLRSGRDIFFDVAAALKNVDANQRDFLVSQLVGIDQSARMGAAFSNINVVMEATNVAMQKTGSVQRELNTQMQSLEFRAAQTSQQWENLSIVIGQRLSGGSKDATASLGSLAQALSTAVNAGSFDAIFNEITALNTGFADFVEKVARNLPDALRNVDFSELVQSVENIGFSLGDIFEGMDLTTTEGLTRAIQFVVDSFTSLNNVVAGIIDAWDPFINAFFKGIDIFNQSGSSVQQYVGLALGLSQVFENMRGLVEAVGAGFSKLGGIFSGISNTGIAATIGGIVAALAAPEILAAGAAFTGIGAGIAGLLGYFDDYSTAQNQVVEASTKLTGSQEQILASLSEISQRTGVSVKSLYDLRHEVDAGNLVFDEASGKYVKAGQDIRNFDTEVKAAAGSQFDFADTVKAVSTAFNLNSEAAKETTQSFLTHEEAMKALMAANSTLVSQSITYENGLYILHQTQKDVAESAGDVAKAHQEVAVKTDELSERQKIAIENTHELEMTLLELASNERIKAMEFTAQIKVADIEAQAEQVVAAFESIGTAIEATQKAQAEIFDSLVEGLASDSIRGLDKQFLQEFAKRQQEQAQQALDNQTMLVEAQTANLNARTEALRNGTALIQINADNLAPELQQVLRSLLEYIQIEANSEGLELLLPG